MAEKEISGVLRDVTRSWDKNAIQIDLKQELLVKRTKVSGQEEYVHLLAGNIAYLQESLYLIQSVIHRSFARRQSLNRVEVQNEIYRALQELKDNLDVSLSAYEEKFKKDTLSESTTAAEIAYSQAVLLYALQTAFLFFLLDPENRNLLKTFSVYPPGYIVSAVNEHSTFYANLLMDELEHQI
ncbi:hypothetical protein [Alkalicoccus urumqiensis]|uniref:Uncharacterized protein n=1 Tax=Alkalicoccus urumqiensis TaxID=1548213 RepID=A0A2P6MHU6_ALKUR|nr:hypothetical protein [Alkalicoccus urumqiensis]PRO65818.1 hypothetical protein C6I21_07930 [Alkalicoccus urumqiensis]